MITAKNVQYMIDIPLAHIAAIAMQNKIRGYVFTGAKFLGITNGGEFCYHVVHQVEGGTDSAKMFMRYDPTADRVIANIG
jgi:glutamine amidotransferase-like uncharacterized protein